MDIAIYGAQGIALGAYEAITTLYPKRSIKCFLVSERGINAETLGGVPVKEIDEFSSESSAVDRNNTQIIIATPENVQPEIEDNLESYGFHNHLRLDADRYSDLVKLFHTKKGEFLPLSALPVCCSKPFIRIFMAKHEKDRKLTGQYIIPEYMIPIQVGAELADTKVANILDNKGDNISQKNVNYSELTALYWMWKNRLEDKAKISAESSKGANDIDVGQYYGLYQYRRVLNLSDDDILRLQDNDVDVVLPFPMPYEPSIHAHHERYIKPVDYEALRQAVKELDPEYYSDFDSILEQRYLYNYNVILAKKTVLRDYCSWLFPILERVEELSVPKGCERADRYIGYMGETLETLYFMRNKDKLNVTHTDCRMLT